MAGMLGVIPDHALSAVLAVIRTAPGQKAREVESLAYNEIDNRRCRQQALGALTPLFRRRTDDLPSLTFPPAILPRLWRAAADRDPEALELVDRMEEDQASFRALGRMRILTAASAALEQEPEAVLGAGFDPQVLAELMACVAMGNLAHNAVRGLEAWAARPDPEQAAEFRLALKDASAVDPEGLRRLMDILVAHLDQPAPVVSLVFNAAAVSGGEARLHTSELALFIERAFVALGALETRILAWRPGEAPKTLADDMNAAATLLGALEAAAAGQAEGDWTPRVSACRHRIASMAEDRLKAVPRAVGRLLPARTAMIAGKSTRRGADLSVTIDAGSLAQAAGLVDFVVAVRSAAARFGCEGQRQALIEGLVTDVSTHVDQALEAVRAGEAKDPATALADLQSVIALLDRLKVPEAGALARRVAAMAADTGARAHAA